MKTFQKLPKASISVQKCSKIARGLVIFNTLYKCFNVCLHNVAIFYLTIFRADLFCLKTRVPNRSIERMNVLQFVPHENLELID